MIQQAHGTFKLQSWEEKPYVEEADGRKLTRASVAQSYSGDLEGEGRVEWLMCYRPDETADFVGLERVEGTLGGRAGAFVVTLDGTFDGKLAKATWSVVPGSGTGELEGLRGSGGFEAPHGPEGTVRLEYDFE